MIGRIAARPAMFLVELRIEVSRLHVGRCGWVFAQVIHLFEGAPDPLRKELEEIEPDSLSPLEALQKLYELRARLSP